MAVKIFVTSKLTALFSCPECGHSDSKDVSKFIGHKTRVRLKYKCRCKHAFSVDLERRRSKRKGVHLEGSIISESKKYAMVVENISKHGLKIILSKRSGFEIGETVDIEFFLDDTHHSKIKRQVRIKKMISDTVFGCEFLSTDHFGELGKYFLFNC